MGLFDSVQDAMFDVVTTTYGDAAIWTPLDSPDTPITANVLKNSPSEVARLFGINYQPETVYIEFKRSAFEGIKESVDKKRQEPISYKGVNYWIDNIYSKADGESLIAELVIDG